MRLAKNHQELKKITGDVRVIYRYANETLKDIVLFILLYYLSICLYNRNNRHLNLITIASQTQKQSLKNELMEAGDLKKIGLDDFLRRNR